MRRPWAAWADVIISSECGQGDNTASSANELSSSVPSVFHDPDTGEVSHWPVSSESGERPPHMRPDNIQTAEWPSTRNMSHSEVSSSDQSTK